MPPEVLLALLLTAGLLIGATGTWSPCGLSMIETIGPSGHSGGKPTTTAAIATFIPGALIGGAVTFGGIAWLGSLIQGGAGGTVAYAVAALVAIAAAWAELRGLPIVPQIRRQLPEHWRRVMPMPLAAGLYGALLGLGFTTFVLSFGVWALAAIAVLAADPAAGLALGLAFGAGRAVPIAVLAPMARSPAGIAARERMTQSRALYRRFRAADGLALWALGLGMLAVGPAAGAATVFTGGAGDPDVSRGTIVAQRDRDAAAHADGEPLGERGAIIRRGERWRALDGSIPAAGGPYIALRRGDDVALLDRESLEVLDQVPGPSTDAIAVSGRWLIERRRLDRGDRLQARRITREESASPGSASIGPASTLARTLTPAQIGQPSLAGNRVFYPVSTRRASRIAIASLTGGASRYLLAARMAAFEGVDARGRLLAYTRTTSEWQEVRLRRLDTGAEKVLHRRPATSRRDPDHARGRDRIPTMDRPPHQRRDPWTVFSLALAPKAVYATLLRQSGGTPRARVLRFPR